MPRPIDRQLLIGLAVLGGLVAFACAGLALDGNWPKLLRVASAFATYAGVLLVRGARTSGFLVGGGLAGVVSGLLRPETSAALVAISALGGTALGAAHGMLTRRMRATRLA